MTIFICITASLFMFAASDTQAASYPAISGDNTYEWITNVTFGDINNSTAQNANGYGDYTYDSSGLVTRVRANGTYPLSITIHPDLTWCDEYLYAYFDWNHDSDFTDSGETVVVAANTCQTGPHSVNVRVPWNAVPGEIRMRIVVRYDGIPLSFGKIPEGEAEDYTIVVEYPTIIGDNRSEWITNVTIQDIMNTTVREANGYGDFTYWHTGETTEIVQDETYSLSVTISPDTEWCEEYVTAFLDWNHDGDFLDFSESVVVAANTCTAGPHVIDIRVPIGPHVIDIRVPINAMAGRTRMRIVLRWRFTPSISGFISGEGEDYTLYVKKRKFPWPMFLPAITEGTK